MKLSIVVPVYNGSKYIESCMENLERQSFTDWEAIFVNDGSSDDSGAVLERLMSRDGRYSCIQKANGGTASTRNAGMARARGRYITFMDVDDQLEPAMYAKLVGLLDSSGADMAVCGYYFKVEGPGGSASYLEEKSYPSCLLRNREEIKARLVDLYDKDMLSNVWNKMYRLELIRAMGLTYRVGQVYTEDWVFNRMFIEGCNSIAVTSECLYYYVRERLGSTSERYRDDYYTIRHDKYLEFQEHFKNLGLWDDRAREYVSREFIERIAGCLENVFHAGPQLTEAAKREKIAWVISQPDVQEALGHARCRSGKMKLLLLPLRWRSSRLTYLLYKAVYEIRRRNPALFHKLKSRR